MRRNSIGRLDRAAPGLTGDTHLGDERVENSLEGRRVERSGNSRGVGGGGGEVCKQHGGEMVETAWRGDGWKQHGGEMVETAWRGDGWKQHGGEMWKQRGGEMGGNNMEGRWWKQRGGEMGGNNMEGRGVETSWVESARRSEALKGRERPSSVSSCHTRKQNPLQYCAWPFGSR